MWLKEFTKSELAYYDGLMGRPAYIAYKGKVYDVTRSYHWRRGIHWTLHRAGQDLTIEMETAPHFDNVLEKFKIVGKMKL